jgi:hypothetical protein
MFGIFRRVRLARQVAQGIHELICQLSIAAVSNGSDAPERLLRKLASQWRDETTGKTRALLALVPMTAEAPLPVTLMLEPDGQQLLVVEGGERYAGFSLTCHIPPQAAVLDLQPGPLHGIALEARLLHAVFKFTRYTVKGSDFPMA